MTAMREEELVALRMLLRKYIDENGTIGACDAALLGTMGSVTSSVRRVQETIKDEEYQDGDVGAGTRQLWRTQFVVEVLSEEPYKNIDTLEELWRSNQQGDVSVGVREIGGEQVTPSLMAGLLSAQYSDPEFLLGDLDRVRK